MPRYTFKLHDDDIGVEDDFGVSLPNAEIAHRYARDVVGELMSHRERNTRHWLLECIWIMRRSLKFPLQKWTRRSTI